MVKFQSQGNSIIDATKDSDATKDPVSFQVYTSLENGPRTLDF